MAAALLGHADTAFLERTYCHPQQATKIEATGVINQLLAPMEERVYTSEQTTESEETTA